MLSIGLKLLLNINLKLNRVSIKWLTIDDNLSNVDQNMAYSLWFLESHGFVLI